MKSLKFLAASLALFVAAPAAAGSRADIVVMTQNQYLGANLAPIIAADTPAGVNAAIINALIAIGNNNYAERVTALTGSIKDKQPHLVSLQEMFAFACFDPFMTGLCNLFPGAFNDHLQMTIDALGGDYQVAAVVQNLTLPPPALGLPGIPVVVGPGAPPIFVSVVDRDVILARADVGAEVVTFDCGVDLSGVSRASVDGCNYRSVVPTSIAGPGGIDIPINIERGFLAVDASVGGADYRFVATHLEVKTLGGEPVTNFFQAAQASELWAAILGTFDPTKRLIVAGDFNSSPADVSPIGLATAYQQFTNGIDLFGVPLPAPVALIDTWTFRPGNPDGFTCCELSDLSNAVSQHDERVDIVFALPAPAAVKANVLNAETQDKTLSGLWPSDHASVSAELSY